MNIASGLLSDKTFLTTLQTLQRSISIQSPQPININHHPLQQSIVQSDTAASSSDNSSDDDDDDDYDDDSGSSASEDEIEPPSSSALFVSSHRLNIGDLQAQLDTAFSLQKKVQFEIDTIYHDISTLYSRCNPNLAKHLPSIKDYTHAVSVLLDSTVTDESSSSNSGNNNNITTTSNSPDSPPTTTPSKQQLLCRYFQPHLALTISIEHHSLDHGVLKAQQYQTIFDGAQEIKSLFALLDQLQPVFVHCASQLAPNLSSLISPNFAAQFICSAQGLQRLAICASHSLPSFGASKQSNAGVKVKTGIIYQIPLIQTVPEHKTNRAVKLLSNKMILAARSDYQGLSTDGSYGEQLLKEILKKLEQYKQLDVYKAPRALPIPGQMVKKTRFSRYGRTFAQIANANANIVKFGGDLPLGDDSLVNLSSSSNSANPQQPRGPIVPLDHRARRRLEHYQRINDMKLNAYPILLGLKKSLYLSSESRPSPHSLRHNFAKLLPHQPQSKLHFILPTTKGTLSSSSGPSQTTPQTLHICIDQHIFPHLKQFQSSLMNLPSIKIQHQSPPTTSIPPSSSTSRPVTPLRQIVQPKMKIF